MSFSQILALAEAGHTLYEILDFVGAPMFGYKDTGLPWPKPGQFKGSMRNPKTVSEYKPMPKKSEMKKTLPVGEANPTTPRKRPRVDYPTPEKTPSKKPRIQRPPKRKGSNPPRAKPAKKTKTGQTMPKVASSKIDGRHGEVVSKFSTLPVTGKKYKKNKKLEQLGQYQHVHSYALKVTSANVQGSASHAAVSFKPSLCMENFCTGGVIANPQNFASYTMMNTRIENLDPNYVTRRAQISNTGIYAGTIQDIANHNSYFFVKSQRVSVHLKNMLNLPARVTCYWVTPKQHTRQNPSQGLWLSQTQTQPMTTVTANINTDPNTLGTDYGRINATTDTVTQGIVDAGDGGFRNLHYLPRGYKPEDFPEFKKKWKILKKDVINMQSGALVVHTVNLKYNKYFSENYANTCIQDGGALPAEPSEENGMGPLSIRGTTVIPMFMFEGYLSQADRGTALNQPTFGNFDVNVGFEVKSVVEWADANKIGAMQTFRSQMLMGAASTAEEFINVIDADATGDPAD